MNFPKMTTLVAASLAVSSFSVPALATESTEATEESKAPKKITDRRHPDYVRCRSEPIIGSLARKRRVCMTNREWTMVARKGNRDSRQFVEDGQFGLNPGAFPQSPLDE